MILSRTTVNLVLLSFVAAILGFMSLFLTLSRESTRALEESQQEECAGHCFPFASKIEDEECLCADLNKALEHDDDTQN